MTPADFDLLANLVNQRSGLVIGRDKLYLLESRLIPIARRRGLTGLDDLAALVRRGNDEPLLRDITEAMTTNESFFFRDVKPFEIFRKETLPHLVKARAGTRRLRIWSATCSSGQEPYSLGMLIREEIGRLDGWHVEILATDLSTEMLDKAKAGIYSQFEVQRGLPVQMLMKYFAPVGQQWQLDASIRGMVKFARVNLLDDLSSFGQFDVVFCRNVLIYFDQPTKTKVLDRISRMIPADGALYLGGAETVLGTTERFRPVPGQRGVYAIAA
jgi:chemotaxis protein methyltransferase CheR